MTTYRTDTSILLCLLTAALLLLSACGHGGLIPEPSARPEPTAEPTPEPTAEPTPEPETPAPEEPDLSIALDSGVTASLDSLTYDGSEIVLTVTVTNNRAEAVTWEIQSVDAGGMSLPVNIRLDIAPGETRPYSYTVSGFTARLIASAGRLDVSVRSALYDEAGTLLEASVSDPLTVEF